MFCPLLAFHAIELSGSVSQESKILKEGKKARDNLQIFPSPLPDTKSAVQGFEVSESSRLSYGCANALIRLLRSSGTTRVSIIDSSKLGSERSLTLR